MEIALPQYNEKILRDKVTESLYDSLNMVINETLEIALKNSCVFKNK